MAAFATPEVDHTQAPLRLKVTIPPAFKDLFRPARYKVYWGGRGSAKSWSVARALIMRAVTQPIRILCAREYQSSIADSVHSLLKTQIVEMGLEHYFDVQTAKIYSHCGAEFIFKGLHHNPTEVKSTEGVDICWVEEAHSVSKESWQVLIPTIRKAGSEIWVTFNQMDDDAETYKRFVLHPMPGALVHCVTWEDNPYFPAELDLERRYMMENDFETYQYVWGRACRTIGSAIIFRGKTKIHTFETPIKARFYHGMDFGFANDPCALIRSYITNETGDNGLEAGEHLWIDQEGVGYHVELDHLPAFMRQSVPTSDKWPVMADNARPETISYLGRQGFTIRAAEKWKGSVEDGITHLRGFRWIHIHERCKHTAQESVDYKYKLDKNTGQVLPEIVDKNNHCWDAERYGLDGLIHKRGNLKMWERLAQ